MSEKKPKPRDFRTVGAAVNKPLTTAMLRVLRIAERDRGSVSAGTGAHKGHVECAPASTILALIRRGLLEHSYGSEGNVGGRLTEAGRAALAEESAPKKSPAQLDADIAETLRKRTQG